MPSSTRLPSGAADVDAAAKTLAVRPFATPDLAEADSYLGVGIADAVTTVLGGVPGVTISPVEAVEDLAGARSLGVEHLHDNKALVLDTFQATDGFFVLQLVREHQLERLAQMIGHPEWLTDPRLATREQWVEHVEDIFRPAIESWAAGLTKLEASHALSDAGIAASPCQSSAEVRVDPHLTARNMLVEMERTDGVEASPRISRQRILHVAGQQDDRGNDRGLEEERNPPADRGRDHASNQTGRNSQFGPAASTRMKLRAR